MRRFLSVLIIISMLFAINVNAAEVVWSRYKAGGEVTAFVNGVEAGDKVIVGVYNENDELVRAASGISEGDIVDFAVNTRGGAYTKTFVWDKDSLEPLDVVFGTITPDGINDDVIFSDNQQANRQDKVVGYRSFDPITGEYMIKLSVTLWQDGDNAIMLGDSNNGVLAYGTSSAILLLTGGNFSVRNGNGNGGYAENAVVLCPAEVNKTYEVVFRGNIADNTYKVIITEGKKRYTSGIMHARLNGESLDTIALVSNSKNTVVTNGCYSQFNFTGRNLQVITNAEDMVLDPVYVYEGFEGLYYGMKIGNNYVRGNNGRLSYDYKSVQDDSAMFIPRDMGDGSHAFVCRSSNNRITIPGGLLSGNALKSSGYVTNDNTQHWILEESENYSKDNLSYYIRHIDSEEYIGTGSSWMTGEVLMLVDESKKVEITFVPLYESSPLYNISKTAAYNNLSDRQRYMMESVYESVAGDVFGRYGGYSEWTPRIRMDNLFNEILTGNFTEAEQLSKLESFVQRGNNSHIYDGQASYQTVSTSLPGTEGLYWEIDEGKKGNYDFWRGTMLDGVLYKYTIYTADGEVQQTINLYVEDNATARKNADTFKNVIVQIPHIFRSHLRNVKVRLDNANSYNGGGGDMYIRLNWSPDANGMRSTVVHELGHIMSSNNGGWAEGGGWASAIALDMYAPSTYGATNATEDFAEFCRMYFSAYGNRDMQRGLKIIMPERYASFGRLRKNNLGGWGLWEDEYTDK